MDESEARTSVQRLPTEIVVTAAAEPARETRDLRPIMKLVAISDEECAYYQPVLAGNSSGNLNLLLSNGLQSKQGAVAGPAPQVRQSEGAGTCLTARSSDCTRVGGSV